MLKLGLFTDLHYAPGVKERTRHCHLGLAKLRAMLDRFRREQVDLVVGLGDIVDEAETAEAERWCLAEACEALRQSELPYRLVLGNHCVWSLTKGQFVEASGQSVTWGALRRKGWRLIFLDGCFRSDGVPYGARNSDWRDAWVSREQVAWLRDELSSPMPTAVFVHQRLDAAPPYGLGNSDEVREILAKSGCVSHVFQGHQHPGATSVIEGIAYETLPAACEGCEVNEPPCCVLELR